MSGNPNHYSAVDAAAQSQANGYISQQPMSIPPAYSDPTAAMHAPTEYPGSGYTAIAPDSQPTPLDKEGGSGSDGCNPCYCSCCNNVNPDSNRAWLCAICTWIGCFECFGADCWAQCCAGCTACCIGMCQC
ncbi:hypothetical protein ABW21_db0203509 [Orbilia brochopaga]|nr:hypothetical protein ABW21_db0203509 [Drechslerella brochopaga]